MLRRSWHHLLLAWCDPRKCPVEINRERRHFLSLGGALKPQVREIDPQLVPQSGLLAERSLRLGREPKNARLGGCAGSPKPTRLSLQIGEMQGDFAKLQGQRRLIPAKGPRISMGWIGVSLIQGAARPSFHSREAAPVFLGDSALNSMSASGLLSGPAHSVG